MRTMHKSFEDKTVISVDVINVLEQGLKNVRDLNGRLRSPYPESRFWFPTDVELMSKKEENLVNDYTTVEQYQVVLQQYKRAFEALSSMSRSVEAEIHRTVRRIRPAVLARGLRMLPDEVLALVLRNLYESFRLNTVLGLRRQNKPEYLRLVCKRFKYVFDSQPSYKAHLSTSMSRAEISKRIKRVSTSVGLRLEFDDSNRCFSTLVDCVVPLAGRWENVYFTFGNTTSLAARMNVKHAYAKLNSLNLPRLKRLTFVMHTTERRKAEEIYSSWQTPNLVDLHCTKVVPFKPGNKSTVKSLNLVYRPEWESFNMAYFDRLTNALGEHWALTSLQLTSRKLTLTSIDLEKVKGAKLPNLRELDVVIEFMEFVYDDSDSLDELVKIEAGEAFYKFIVQLETPVLQRLAITDENAAIWENLTNTFIEDLTKAQTNSNLLNFEFTGGSDRRYLRTSTLLTILGNLNVDGSVIFSKWRIDDNTESNGSFSSPACHKSTRKLRKLRLRMCSLDEKVLQTLLSVLIKTDYFPDFEEIVLTQCSGFTMESLRGMYGMEFVRSEY